MIHECQKDNFKIMSKKLFFFVFVLLLTVTAKAQIKTDSIPKREFGVEESDTILDEPGQL